MESVRNLYVVSLYSMGGKEYLKLTSENCRLIWSTVVLFLINLLFNDITIAKNLQIELGEGGGLFWRT